MKTKTKPEQPEQTQTPEPVAYPEGDYATELGALADSHVNGCPECKLSHAPLPWIVSYTDPTGFQHSHAANAPSVVARKSR